MRKYFRICLFSFLSGWDCFISFPLLFSAFLVRLLPTAGLHLPMPFLEYYKLQCLEKVGDFPHIVHAYPYNPPEEYRTQYSGRSGFPTIRQSLCPEPEHQSVCLSLIPCKPMGSHVRYCNCPRIPIRRMLEPFIEWVAAYVLSAWNETLIFLAA